MILCGFVVVVEFLMIYSSLEGQMTKFSYFFIDPIKMDNLYLCLCFLKMLLNCVLLKQVLSLWLLLIFIVYLYTNFLPDLVSIHQSGVCVYHLSAWDLFYSWQSCDVREISRSLIGCLEIWEPENTWNWNPWSVYSKCQLDNYVRKKRKKSIIYHKKSIKAIISL